MQATQPQTEAEQVLAGTLNHQVSSGISELLLHGYEYELADAVGRKKAAELIAEARAGKEGRP